MGQNNEKGGKGREELTAGSFVTRGKVSYVPQGREKRIFRRCERWKEVKIDFKG